MWISLQIKILNLICHIVRVKYIRLDSALENNRCLMLTVT